MMEATPKGLRLQIGIFGRRNVGKSSLFNQLLHQEIAIVSDTPGTTTDPVEKAMEFLPLGPVVFVDTAGIDDIGALGAQRVEKTRRVVNRIDLAILVTDAWGEYENGLLVLFGERKIPVIVVANKADQRRAEGAAGVLEAEARTAILAATQTTCELPIESDVTRPNVITVAAKSGEGIEALRQALILSAPDDFLNPPSILGGLVSEGELVVLVVPVDKEAPKGRIILPQVQVIRDLLDRHASALVVQDTELAKTLDRLKNPPVLVVTDSQAFARVAADTPESIPMTSFSILFARYKGDLTAMVQGAMAIDRLQPGAKILVGEACTHHPIGDDIGRLKIPNWLREKIGGEIELTVVAGRDYPDDVRGYDLVIHCGACVWNRREMLTRIESAHAAHVPITNYGLAISKCLNIFERALQPFPMAYNMYKENKTH